ncbi:MAG: fibronectin type III domain-containing protein [Gammaproteobacteria bacterium]
MITWITDESSDSVVDFGLTPGYGSNAGSAAQVTAHIVHLTGLVPGAFYHFRVSSTDASGNKASSSDLAFTTKTDVSPIFKLSLPEHFQHKIPALIQWKVPEGFDPRRKAAFHFSKDGVKWSRIKKIKMEKQEFYWKPGKKRVTETGSIRMCAKPKKGKNIEPVCETQSDLAVLP